MARNKGGETGFQCRLSVIEKEQVVAPKFVERFTTIHVKQGEPVSLHARAVGTPIPKLTWQKDNALVTPGIYLHHHKKSNKQTNEKKKKRKKGEKAVKE